MNSYHWSIRIAHRNNMNIINHLYSKCFTTKMVQCRAARWVKNGYIQQSSVTLEWMKGQYIVDECGWKVVTDWGADI